MSTTPSNFEQYMLELANRLRMDPGGEYDRLIHAGLGVGNVQEAIDFFGVDVGALKDQLAALKAVAPLAWNGALADAADTHSKLMVQFDDQSHNLPGEASLSGRIAAAGYGNYVSLGENVYAFAKDAFYGHAAYVIDWGYDAVDAGMEDQTAQGDGIQDPAAHRETIMSPDYSEIGIGVVRDTDLATSVGEYVTTQEFGHRSDYKAKFVGVVVSDTDGDAFYDIGEGRGGVTITLTRGGDSYTTTSWASGGWQIEVPQGTYDVKFSGGGLDSAVTHEGVTLGSENVKLDLYTFIDPRAKTVADAAETKEDLPVVIDVLANDTRAEDGEVSIGTGPAHGKVSVGADGRVTYTPDANFSGKDSFTYTVTNAAGESAGATVSVLVSPVNDAPVAVRDTVSLKEDSALSFDPLANDRDADGGKLSVSALGLPSNGEIKLNDDGIISYTPAAHFNGSDSFTYQVSDGQGGFATGTITVKVAAVNDAPTAIDDTARTRSDTSVVLDLLANDSDVEGDALSLLRIEDAASGSAVLNEDGTVTYTPGAHFEGIDSFEYVVSDGNGGEARGEATIIVTDVNTEPTGLTLDAGPVAENSADGIVIGQARAEDAEGDALSYTLEDDAGGRFGITAGGALLVANGALLDYETATSHEIRIRVSDGFGGTVTQDFTIAISDRREADAPAEGGAFVGTAGDDDMVGSDGADALVGGGGADRLTGGAGADSFAGLLGDFDGDTITDFSSEDQLVFDARIFAGAMERAGSLPLVLSVSAEGESASIVFEGAFDGGDFMVSGNSDGGSVLRFVEHLTSLDEAIRLGDEQINGIANPDYLSGDTAQAFEVRLQESAAANANSLGVYEIDAEGKIVDVRIIAADVKTADEAIIVGDVDAGHQLGFFLLQDGASRVDAAVLESGSLGIEIEGGKAVLTDGGVAVSGATLFVSHDAALNPNGHEHVVSGVAADGSGALRVGFEDLAWTDSTNDGDFQDVVFQVEALPPLDLIA